ncbi:putative benzoate 4-monooxygenase cytochrome P450 [Lasiosphaeria miniovina]|uniref:Benzoate 4-monooxygenase cytochrome P450 n=1 Tax=Lasiosphaeria miniovina TaxID=1954250 RepID=A0AA40DW17_9PEZI|nr:putative benzoate 4-monooxygenase cytochrome P450 [Lasiosphaeria miniovina]KAK0718474.1 putative benzoate 4-monooxygenase cytochrome P450 [Lasiosphaeria miniovina]
MAWHTSSGINTAFAVGAVIVCGYLVRNIYFHALSNHPGPKLWAATRLPWCWNQYRGNLSRRLKELHDQYGPAVRVAPDEISYISASAWKTIYGQRPVEMPKDPNFSLLTPSGVQNILTADRETHTRQRRLLSHAFSEKALREQESILQTYCTKLCSQLEDRCRSGPVDLFDWFTFSTFDLIGDLAFGQSFGCLDAGAAPPFVQSIKTGSRELMLNQMLRYYGLLFMRPIMGLLGPRNVAGSRAANMGRAVATVQERVARGPTADRKDFWHYVLGHIADNEGGVRDAKTTMTEPEMYTNAFSISIAGSESTATTLTGTTFLLLRHPHAYRRVVEEVRSAFASESDITSNSLSAAGKLPFLEAVLNESMRLYPPVAITLPRRVPAGGETIDGRFVPGGYTVGVNHLACYRSEVNFAEASAFRPERWTECFKPFSHGPRSCLGKNLAWAELRLILARFLWRFDTQLACARSPVIRCFYLMGH